MRLIALLGSTLALASCGGEPQDPARAALVASLDAAQAANSSWSRLDGTEDVFVTLADGAETSIPVRIGANTTVHILGRCGTGCSDIDMELTDATENIQASDSLRNNTPQIDHTVGTAGDYRIVIDMWECSQPTCQAAVRVLTARTN